jgi:thiamine-phosphate pyrophosphorylase
VKLSGVYGIVDVTALDARGLDVVAHAASLLSAPLAALQLRAKDAAGGRVVTLASEIAKLARAARVPFFMNDRVDVALLAGAGVHLGQDDLSPSAARDLAQRAGIDVAIGFSTHNEAQAMAALALPIDYLAIGPVFDTSSKLRPDPVLGAALARELSAKVRARRPDLPIVAIGGIEASRLGELGASFDAVAVIGALLPEAGRSSDARARDFARAFTEVRG